MPPAQPGMRIGLFGGSFNPPHEGHLLVAETARRRLGLDKVWWMVTPGNPLKDHGKLRPIGERLAAVRALAPGPHSVPTAFEARHRIRYSADTVALLRRRHPGVHFVWIMGADSLASFHRWQDWQEIAASLPIAVVDRPGSTLSVLSAVTPQVLARFRLPETAARALPSRRAPAWVFLHGPRSTVSSTLLRRQNGD
ncbi:nicotinate-nucleotide adenylyltransferase [Aurantimonas coralicida]|uniref:nicotinate-nucleotide adenylyltransferase n=1 Tax=Aurantimonas coralicida TaxID=182270 RepID=UPI001E583EBC|nr:nicotinate-nucleotide adenylyltransferase [Aurantimonas coralicida]MCD1641544.1 nicotinate-nucleotide adenylyltransferase [Aurantimonas coralicida]